jgi:hypothetical protein
LLEESDADLSSLDPPEQSDIISTALANTQATRAIQDNDDMSLLQQEATTNKGPRTQFTFRHGSESAKKMELAPESAHDSQHSSITHTEEDIEREKKPETEDNKFPQSTEALGSPRISAFPTYPKIHRQHLDIETLHYYDIPYEYAQVCIPTDPIQAAS